VFLSWWVPGAPVCIWSKRMNVLNSNIYIIVYFVAWTMHFNITVYFILLCQKLGALELCIYILAHSLCKSWIFHDPKKDNIMKYIAFCGEKYCATCHKQCSKYICWWNVWNMVIRW
jgi:hypothetical protein